MKILFLMRHAMYVRNYESVIRELAEKGHTVRLGFLTKRKVVHDAQPEALSKEYENVSFGYYPTRNDSWAWFLQGIRASRDFLRYLHPRYKHADKLRARAAGRLTKAGQIGWRLLTLNHLELMLSLWDGALRFLEKSMPASEYLIQILETEKPNVLVVTPLVDMGSPLVDYQKAAALLRVPVVYCVASWDNLTNKGVVHVQPSLTVLWNRFMKEEAVSLHHIPEDSVRVTGAQIFDHWFEREPFADRQAFCRNLDFDPDKPILLYLASSGFIDEGEAKFSVQWLKALRAVEDDRLAGANILIRPHPANAGAWEGADFAGLGHVKIWPKAGEHPIDAASKSSYFDSMYHAAAVVGINTSAFLEAGIVGRPCLTVQDPSFSLTQGGTLHYRYLVKEGLLITAESLDEHVGQLRNILAGKDEVEAARRKHFIEVFLRPAGLDRPATPLVTAAIEEGMSLWARPIDVSLFHLLVRLVLWLPILFISGFFRGASVVTATCRRGLIMVAHLTVKVLRFSPFIVREPFLWVLTLAKYTMLGDLKNLKRTFLKGLRPIKAVLRFVLRPILSWIRSHNFLQKEVVSRMIPIWDDGNNKALAQVPFFMGQSSLWLEDLKKVVEGKGQILVGPWMSEVGFEVLYWAPFIRWVQENYNIDPDRFVIVSRGGTRQWYQGIGKHYVDIFNLFSSDEYAKALIDRQDYLGGQKQTKHSSFEVELVERLVKSGDLNSDYKWLHPKFMYMFFLGVWRDSLPISFARHFTRYIPLDEDASVDIPVTLPKDFVVVKFYFSNPFPQTPENVAFVNRTITRLAEKGPVVLLSTGLKVDDHDDVTYQGEGNPNIINLEGKIPVENNLAVQTAIVARAKMFIGTYGGFSYIAPLHGVPSVSIYSDPEMFLPGHLLLAGSVFSEKQYASFTAITVEDAERLGFC